MSLFDLSWAVGTFATHNVTVRRFGQTTVVNGRVIGQASTTFATRGSVQPITGRDIQRLPEGVNVGDVVSVWLTSTDVRVTDELEIDGVRYQVEHVDAWEASGNYQKTIARKKHAREASVSP